MHMSSPAELSALDGACFRCDEADAVPHLAEPLTPPDCDLRSSGMVFMPLDVGRMMDSDQFAMATGEEFKAAMALYAKAWLQVPAASLPNDDRVLAHLAGGYTPRRWRKVKDVAMRGWILCADGRLYHPVIAEFAHDAWEKSKHTISDATPTRRASSPAERARRYRERQRLAKLAASAGAEGTVTAPVTRDAVRPTVTETVTASVTQNVTPVTPSFKSETKEGGENVTASVTRHGATAVTDVTRDPVTAPQRQLPVLSTMPAAPGADAPSPPPFVGTKPNPGKPEGRHLTADEQTLCGQVWAQYGSAYHARYGADPLQDGKARRQVADLVRSLGAQAPAIAAWYVGHGGRWYVEKGHDIGSLLADVGKLRTEFIASQVKVNVLSRVQGSAPGPARPPVPAPEKIKEKLQRLQSHFTSGRFAPAAAKESNG
ncbi:conserved hypothetical protein [Thiomonas sp. CB2]|uniref:DUF1376 domain-containing protein n=2 Tax=Thiomonas TaxID=32012 RepID=UPI0004DBC34D|nr:DUF1376 domain-containing protein [Thiomonas sp. Sup16B3]CDW96297.1 conserved hypothetical protein [Thiomonas sp. CB2]VDY06769.1 conserved protein of unknown function [Thiomonas sp. Bio17B3]VDY15044.1 conserved protein of unknown function [Thiomonas sp. OC7]VDY09934.1 conserved protein of unknown function [Thiomonas sp. Sup16B3]VDY11178.1 conserved protein of unknown function [Thiomonas sp. Sup16B3]